MGCTNAEREEDEMEVRNERKVGGSVIARAVNTACKHSEVVCVMDVRGKPHKIHRFTATAACALSLNTPAARTQIATQQYTKS